MRTGVPLKFGWRKVRSMTAEPQSGPDSLAREFIRELKGYVPGEQPRGRDWIKLNTNENPYPPSPRVEQAIKEAIPGLERYPNPKAQAARKAIARDSGLGPEHVLVGNGSDDVLNLVFRAFTGPEAAAGALDPSYSLYPILAGIQGTPFVRVPLPPDLEFPATAIAESGTRVFFLTSPNAPLGIGFSNAEIRALAEIYEGLLVVDEAYGAFAKESAQTLLEHHPRLVVTRSFSKSHSLAGLRIGYLLGHPEVIGELDKVRDSYNVDALAQAGLVAALSDPDYYRATIGKIKNIRNYYLGWFRDLGWDTFPSQANFITTRPVSGKGEVGVEVAESCFAFLKSRKVLVRHFPQSPLIRECLRISVGDEDQMEALEEAVEAWIKSEKA